MRVRKTAGAFVTVGHVFATGLIFALVAPSAHAAASWKPGHGAARSPVPIVSARVSHAYFLHAGGRSVASHRGAWARVRGTGGGLQCVTFARGASGIDLS